MLQVLQVHSHRGVACETNALHVWIQFHGALRTLQFMTSPHGVGYGAEGTVSDPQCQCARSQLAIFAYALRQSLSSPGLKRFPATSL